MMSVLEYAQDVNKSIEEIFKLCEKLDIKVNSEDDLLSDEEITILDNEIQDSEDYIVEEKDEENEYDDDEFFEKVESLAADTKIVNEKQKSKIKNNHKMNLMKNI